MEIHILPVGFTTTCWRQRSVEPRIPVSVLGTRCQQAQLWQAFASPSPSLPCPLICMCIPHPIHLCPLPAPSLLPSFYPPRLSCMSSISYSVPSLPNVSHSCACQQRCFILLHIPQKWPSFRTQDGVGLPVSTSCITVAPEHWREWQKQLCLFQAAWTWNMPSADEIFAEFSCQLQASFYWVCATGCFQRLVNTARFEQIFTGTTKADLDEISTEFQALAVKHELTRAFQSIGLC